MYTEDKPNWFRKLCDKFANNSNDYVTYTSTNELDVADVTITSNVENKQKAKPIKDEDKREKLTWHRISKSLSELYVFIALISFPAYFTFTCFYSNSDIWAWILSGIVWLLAIIGLIYLFTSAKDE